MPADSYSLFPSTSDVPLRRKNSRRQSSRPGTPSSSAQQPQVLPKRSTSLRVRPVRNEEEIERTPIEQDEMVMSGALLGSAPRQSRDATSKPIELQARAVPQVRPRRSMSARSRQSMQHTRAPSAPPDRPLPAAPIVTAAPEAPTNPEKSDGMPESQMRPMIEAYMKHTRNLTNNTISSGSTATTAFKASPMSATSATESLFSPITPPVSESGSVTYPCIPKLSSSPAPSLFGGWAPPRRSNTRATDTTEKSGVTGDSSVYTQTAVSLGEFRSQTVPPGTAAGLSRSPSMATTFVEGGRPGNFAASPASRREPAVPPASNGRPFVSPASRGYSFATPAPFQSLFPQYNHDLPYSRQEYVPNYARLQGIAGQRMPHENAMTAHSVRAASPPSMSPQPQQLPPRSQSIGADQMLASSSSKGPQQTSKLPYFEPPPRRATAPDTRRRQKSTLKAAKSPKPKTVLWKRGPSQPAHRATPRRDSEEATKSAVANAAASARAAHQSDDSDIDDSISDDESVMTKTKDTYKASNLFRPNPTLQKVVVPPKPVKMRPAQSQSVPVTTRAPVHASDTVDGGPPADAVQHSAQVALGALTFAVGLGVEMVGGVVRRRPSRRRKE